MNGTGPAKDDENALRIPGCMFKAFSTRKLDGGEMKRFPSGSGRRDLLIGLGGMSRLDEEALLA